MTDPAKAGEETKQSGAQPEGKMSEFVDWVESISVRELAQLVKMLEGRLGVSAAMPVAMAAGGAAPADQGAAAAAEKTDFSVILTSAGAQKIAVIKEIRAVTGLGLKESKDMVEAAPKPVKEGVSKDEAEKIKAKLEAAGAKVEIK